MSYRFNPFTGTLDLVGGSTTVGGGVTVPELDTDPSSPSNGDVWVLREGGQTTTTKVMPVGVLASITKTVTTTTSLEGSPIGLLLALTYPGPIYQFSFQSEDGVIRRTELT